MYEVFCSINVLYTEVLMPISGFITSQVGLNMSDSTLGNISAYCKVFSLYIDYLYKVGNILYFLLLQLNTVHYKHSYKKDSNTDVFCAKGYQ